eukprot:gene40078-49562_t
MTQAALSGLSGAPATIRPTITSTMAISTRLNPLGQRARGAHAGIKGLQGQPGKLVVEFAAGRVRCRLAKTALAPAAVEDTLCALQWVGRNAKRFNFDLGKVVTTGGSAGGHLALATAMIPSDSPFTNQCAYLGSLPSRYYLELRLQRARQLLLETNSSIVQVGLMCGFSSGSHFSTAFGTLFGGVGGPWLFGVLIAGGSSGEIMWGYMLGAALMIAAALVTLKLGVAAECKSLEERAASLAQATRTGRA